MASLTLCQLLNDSAHRWPDRVAVGTAAGDRKATYRDLHALTHDPAAKLHGLGISRTDTVAIFSDNSMDFVLALLGVLFLGAAAPPLNPELAPAEISDDDKAEAWWRSSSSQRRANIQRLRRRQGQLRGRPGAGRRGGGDRA